MRRLFLILAAALLLSSGASAAVCPDIIIPKPVGYEVFEGEYILKGDGSDIRVHSADRNFLRELKALSLKDFAYNEAYRLIVGKRGVDIYCTGDVGEYRARQSLSYMASFSDTLSFCSIVDYPRFAHRGIMLDISRNFRDKDFILRQIDVLDMLKMNSLHLHLADDAGWRVEISSYPRLTGYAAWRKGKEWTEWRSSGKHYAEQGSPEATGGFLTKEDVAEIVSYARKKNINIIPEIEMPGHSAELLAAYPEVACLSADGKEKVFSSDVCPGNEETFRILEGILDEVIGMFPSTYIHIGGDEASKSSWKECPLCRKRMEEEHLDGVDGLQSYLVHRIEDYLESKGRHLLGWDEIMQGGLAPSATVMSWRGTANGIEAAAMGHDVIMSPNTYCYIDYYQDAPLYSPLAIGGYIPLTRIYSYDPLEGVPEEHFDHILGVQANLWTEFVPTEEHVEYMLYPRTFAVAEIGWTPQTEREFTSFRGRSVRLVEQLKDKGYHPFDLANEYGDRPESYVKVDHLARGCEVKYSKPYSRTYSADGETALTDGKQGGWAYSKSDWQGFNGDMDVTIDLGKVQPLHYVGAWFYSCYTNWITFPERTEVWVSEDGENFTLASTVTCQIKEDRESGTMYSLFGAPVDVTARYVRMLAVLGTQPQHGFVFTDEIVVK